MHIHTDSTTGKLKPNARGSQIQETQSRKKITKKTKTAAAPAAEGRLYEHSLGDLKIKKQHTEPTRRDVCGNQDGVEGEPHLWDGHEKNMNTRNVGFGGKTKKSWTAVQGIVLFLSTWVIGHRFLKNGRIFVFFYKEKEGSVIGTVFCVTKTKIINPLLQPSLSPPRD